MPVTSTRMLSQDTSATIFNRLPAPAKLVPDGTSDSSTESLLGSNTRPRMRLPFAMECRDTSETLWTVRRRLTEARWRPGRGRGSGAALRLRGVEILRERRGPIADDRVRVAAGDDEKGVQDERIGGFPDHEKLEGPAPHLGGGIEAGRLGNGRQRRGVQRDQRLQRNGTNAGIRLRRQHALKERNALLRCVSSPSGLEVGGKIRV